MKILQTIKYYDPCKGGMEAVAKTLVEGAIVTDSNINFTVYCNNHVQNKNVSREIKNKQLTIIRESTPVLVKSQPLNLSYKNLKELIIENDVVHHHYPFPTMEIALLKNINLLKKKRFVITWHANIQNSRWSWIAKFYNPIIKKLLKIADKIVVTSPQLFEQSDILKDFQDKVEIIPLSFDPKFISSEPKNITYENKEILFVGKLREYKGVKYLIEAMQNVDAKLNIVGNGEKEDDLKKLTTDLNLVHKITFNTNASDDDLLRFYKESHLFVLPSINEAEAFGVVQLEALSSGLPVINTQLKSGVPYVSLDNVTGFTVEPENIEQLQDSINKIFNNAELYLKFSKNALARAKEFSIDKMVEKYQKIYVS